MRALSPSPEQFRFGLFLLLLGSGIYGEVLAQADTPVRPVVKTQGYIPFAEAPIHYRSAEVHDPIAKLQTRLDDGSEALRYDPQRGYLPAVLRALQIPESSQTLVFSKTSFQFPQIGPSTPRALYFNDDVYVGRVHDAKFLEFVSFDPVQGAVFYVLDERESDHPIFERAAEDCVQCHVAAATHGVPGVMMRSVVTRSTGYPVSGTPSFITGHESPIEQRWGGWYVPGLQGAGAQHMGNSVRSKAASGASVEAAIGQVLQCSTYLRYTSDAVALLVLAHQTQMHNMITKVGYAARMGSSEEQVRGAADELVRYLLFKNEAPLDGVTIGDSPFVRDFTARAQRDPAGRSLRDFDLHHRLFRYPCSYLIYSDDFNALPSAVKQYIYDRLFDILSGPHDDVSGLTASERQSILEILAETKPDLPQSWKQHVTKHYEQSAYSAPTRASVAAIP